MYQTTKLQGRPGAYSLHEFTGRPLWTESYQVIHTNDSPSVPMSAEGTCNTKLSSSHSIHPSKSQQTPAHHARTEQQHSPLDLQPQNSNCGEHIPCLQKPLSYQGQSLILDSGSMCKNGHSLLLHSPVPKANTLLSQLCRTEIKMTLKTLPGSCSSHRAVTNIFKFRHNSLTACLNLHEELQGLTPAEPSSTSLDYLCFQKQWGN